MADPNSNTMVPFRREGNNIYSNETDKCVAVIDEDGTLKVQYGYNAMTPRIKAFLNEDAENKNDIFENTAPLKEPDLPLQNDSPANDDRAPDTQLQPEHAIDGGTGKDTG